MLKLSRAKQGQQVILLQSFLLSWSQINKTLVHDCASSLMVHENRFAVKKIQIPWNIMGSHLIHKRFLAIFFCKLLGVTGIYSKIQLILNLKAGVSSLLSFWPPETRGLLWLIWYVKHFGNYFRAALRSLYITLHIPCHIPYGMYHEIYCGILVQHGIILVYYVTSCI